MGRYIRKVTSVIFFLLALIMILSGAAGYFIMSSESDAESSIKKLQREFKGDVDLRQDRIDNAIYDEDVEFARGSDIAEAKKHYHSSIEEYGIGSVYMPSANITVPILAGTSEWNLFNGVGTGRPDQELGEGLFVALSHNLVNDRLLKNIDQINSGDYVYTSDFTNVYIYQVIDQKVVHESETDFFHEPKEDESAKLLLYRCEGESGTDWRRAVYSEFVDSKPLSDIDLGILDGLGIEYEDVDIEGSVEVSDGVLIEDGFFDILVNKFVSFTEQHKGLNDYFLSVYSLADSNPIAFGFIAVVFFILYVVL